MGKIKCPKCVYESDIWSVKRHFKRKHKKQSATTSGTYEGQSATQQSNTYPLRAPAMVANNIYYAQGTRAPTVMSVGPNGSRAPTTVSVQPLTGGVLQGSGIGDQFHRHNENQPIPQHWFIAQHPHGYEYGEEVRAPTKVSVGPNHQPPTTKISVGPNGPRVPTTVSVPPVIEKVQHGDGIKMDDEDEDDTDSVINAELDKKELDDEDMDTDGGDEDDTDDEDEDDTDEDDKEEQDVFDILVDIAQTFNYLKDLRKQYRDLLPQLTEMKKQELDSFLEVYSHVKTNIIEEQDGLEGTVYKKQHGKGLTESEGETDEETDNEDSGNDADTEADNETDEETVDSEEEETEENDDDDVEADMDVKFDTIHEDEQNKEPFFNFVFEAEHFLDPKSKEKLEEYLIRDKKNRKLEDGCDQDETNNPKNVYEVIEDIEEVFDKWNEKEEECFKQCSKRKIQSVSNVAYTWMDATSLNKMKKLNPSKYKFLKKMLSPHTKSLEKLVNPQVSIHEKRKTLQKSQVGDGLLQTATHLMLPLLRQALNI